MIVASPERAAYRVAHRRINALPAGLKGLAKKIL
jgi:hypothetical protein